MIRLRAEDETVEPKEIKGSCWKSERSNKGVLICNLEFEVLPRETWEGTQEQKLKARVSYLHPISGSCTGLLKHFRRHPVGRTDDGTSLVLVMGFQDP